MAQANQTSETTPCVFRFASRYQYPIFTRIVTLAVGFSAL